jgi:hypothetical protein
LRPVRAPDPTAARNGKVDAQLYTSAIGFFHNKREAAASLPPCPSSTERATCLGKSRQVLADAGGEPTAHDTGAPADCEAEKP